MVRVPKKGTKGIATTYISRKQALKKLQLSLKDFRRLCILKGIYPAEPHHKKKANKNNSKNKTYYYVKDVQFLLHEPLLEKFRSFKVFVRRLKRATGRKDRETTERLENNRPIFKLDHIVKERYPTFIDALRDLDDAISMCFLFATFPKSRHVKAELIQLCRRLTVEFMHYVVETKALRKVFISIKGFYYQAEILGQQITWIVPHAFGYCKPLDVDFKIMVTFADFYSTMLGFVNYKLYNSINLVYPPKLAVDCSSELLKGEEENSELVAALNISLKSCVENNLEEVQIDEFPETADTEEIQKRKAEQEKIEKLKNLFVGCKMFINREVPLESLLFIIRCFGGEVSFDKIMHVGATFDVDDETITHHIIDRPLGEKQYLNRFYVQPQWVFDSVNARMLLPVEQYFPGEVLPPHLSPFVEETEGDYIPPEKKALLDFQKGLTKSLPRMVESSEDESDSSEEQESDKNDESSNNNNKRKRKDDSQDSQNKRSKMKVTEGVPVKTNSENLAAKEAAEEKRLAIMTMHKKDKHLYNKIIYGQKRKKRENLKLQEKREKYNKEQKMLKKRKKNDA